MNEVKTCTARELARFLDTCEEYYIKDVVNKDNHSITYCSIRKRGRNRNIAWCAGVRLGNVASYIIVDADNKSREFDDDLIAAIDAAYVQSL